MCRGSPVCKTNQSTRCGTIQDNVIRHKIAETLNISSSTVYNIKRFKETGEIFVCKGQSSNSVLGACDLQALRQQKKKKTGMEITVNTVHCAITNSG